LKTYRITIPGRLPSLNDYIEADRKSPYVGAQLKKHHQQYCALYVSRCLHGTHIEKPVTVSFTYYEPTKTRDVDNISGFAHKVIFDALVQTKVLKDDSQRYVTGLKDDFKQDRKNPRIEVEINEND